MAEAAAPQRQHVFYSGRVQGVGFRYTVRSVASHCGVTGYVRNLPDGRVELVAEGAAGELERLLYAVEAELGRYIRGQQRQTTPATGQFQGFDIRF